MMDPPEFKPSLLTLYENHGRLKTSISSDLTRTTTHVRLEVHHRLIDAVLCASKLHVEMQRSNQIPSSKPCP